MSNTVSRLIKEAVLVLPRAYAPYSNFSVACCIESDSGKTYCGVNVENVAYSQCICAEATAIAAMVTAGERCIKQVVVLSDKEALCSPCGSCRQQLSEFSSNDCLIHLCNHTQPIKTLRMDELLPLVFSF